VKINPGKLLLSGVAGLVLIAGVLQSRREAVREAEPGAEFPLKELQSDDALETDQPPAALPAERHEPERLAAPSSVVLPDPDEIRQWTRERPNEALAWLQNAASGPQRDAVVEIACALVAETDPVKAVALAERYAGGCSNLLENLVLQWSDRNEADARAYALSQPAGDERDRLLSRVALTHSKANPAEAAKLVVDEMAPGEVQNEAVMTVLHQWALRDPSQAQAWVKLFPEGDLKIRAVKEIENLSRQPGLE
jgi:hypothetical protein